jgi:hypothetical protein
MTTCGANPRRNSREGGYALLMVLFIAALMMAVVMTAAPNILTQGKREKEEEMIWRGKQYVRGIKLYYRKLGRFPTSLDDLTKPKVGTLRFMRQAYKDPMNKEDGSWRLIYVGPGGQLIGSLKPPQTINLAAAGSSQMGTPAATLAGANPQPGANAGPAPAGTQAGATPASPGSQTQQNPPAEGQADPSANPAPGAPTDTPTIIGGNIIGVGSKAPERSVKVYEKAKTYRLFEFVWDPSKDALNAGQPAGIQVGTPNAPGQGQVPVVIPIGAPPVPNPMNPTPNQPQLSNPNPTAPPQ